MKQYMTKRIAIHAMQWNPGNLRKAGPVIGTLIGEGVDFRHPEGLGEATTLRIETSEGPQTAQPGDWIIRTPDGNWGVVTKQLFAARYEPADDLPGIA